MIAIPIKETKKAVFFYHVVFAPKSIENKIPLPIHNPKIIEVKKVMIVNEEPTAAKAFDQGIVQQ